VKGDIEKADYGVCADPSNPKAWADVIKNPASIFGKKRNGWN